MQYFNPPSDSLLTFDGHFMKNESVVYDNISRTNEAPTATPNNVSCPFSKHEWLTAKFYVIAVTGTSLAILGILGNITTAMVLCRPSMRSSNNMYLTALAIFDTFLLITAILLYGMEYVYEYTDDYGLYRLWHYYVPVVYAFSHIAQTGSVYITVSVTMERFIAVVYPDRSKYVCTPRNTGSTIFWVTCFAVLFNMTKFFEVETDVNEQCMGRFGAYALKRTALQQDELYSTVYSLWMTQFVMVFAPFLALTIFNTIIAFTIRKTFKRLSWVQKGKKRDELKDKSREANYVLVVIVLIFLICNSWGFVLAVMERMMGDEYLYRNMTDFYVFSREAINFLTIVNSSINFVIYCIFGKDFRRQVVNVYVCSCTVFLPVGDKFSSPKYNAQSRRSTMIQKSEPVYPPPAHLLNRQRQSSVMLIKSDDQFPSSKNLNFDKKYCITEEKWPSSRGVGTTSLNFSNLSPKQKNGHAATKRRSISLAIEGIRSPDAEDASFFAKDYRTLLKKATVTGYAKDATMSQSSSISSIRTSIAFVPYQRISHQDESTLSSRKTSVIILYDEDQEAWL